MRNEAEVNRALKLYADTVRRICFMYLKNDADVEDVFQEVFLKYLLHPSSLKAMPMKRHGLFVFPSMPAGMY